MTGINVIPVDVNGVPLASPGSPVPAGATQLVATSGIVGNATAAATLGNASGQTTYISGFDITGLGATAAGSANVTVGALVGNVTLNYVIGVPGTATSPITPLAIQFNPPIPAVSGTASVTVSAPTFGAGNTKAVVNAYGWRK